MVSAGPLILRYAASGGALTLAAAAQLATFAILARAFGPQQFGLYVQFTAGAAIAVQLCGLGASDCLIRRVSRDHRLYGALLGHALILIALSGALLVALGVPIVHWRLRLDPRPAAGLGAAAMLLASNIVLTRLALLIETVFLSIGRVPDANRSVVGFALARTLIAATACYALEVRTIAQWAPVQFSGYLLYVIACGAWVRSLGKPDRRLLRDEVKPGLYFASQFAARAVRQNIDLFILGAALPPAATGSYGLARRITDSGFLTIDAMNRLLYPRFARASRRSLADALPDARKAVATASLIGLATAACIYLGAPDIRLLFGRSYGELVPFLRILSGLIVVVAVWSIALDVLGAGGFPGVRAAIANGASLLGSLAIYAASAIAVPTGTFAALYATECATAAAAWIVLLALARRAVDRS